MSLRRFLLMVAATALVLRTPITLAQTPVEAHRPNPQHGAVIAAQGTPAGAPACAQCHAFNGASDGSGAFPRLAGQAASYLATELDDFTSGIRKSAIMSPIAKALSPDERADVAAYYARIDAPFPPLKSPDPAPVKAGETLAAIGSAPRQIQACDNCHGPGGTGEPPAIPYLAGQYAQYISFALQMWQQGFRKNSPGSMALIAKKLSPQEIAAVAAYFQQVNASVETAAAPGKN